MPAETGSSCTKRCVVHRWKRGLRYGAVRIIRFRSCSPRTRDLTARVDPAEIRRLLDPEQPRRHGAAARAPAWPTASNGSRRFRGKPKYGCRTREQRHRDRARQDEDSLRESRRSRIRWSSRRRISISAGDGARRNEIAGKGRLAAQTTARVFRLLNLCGLPTHYLNGGEDDDNNEMVVRRCNMIPLEVVTRGVAAGSFVKRNPASSAERCSCRT